MKALTTTLIKSGFFFRFKTLLNEMVNNLPPVMIEALRTQRNALK